MLGLVLLYVGIVLINNGLSGLLGFAPKSAAFMNMVVGTLSVFANFVMMAVAAANGAEATAYWGMATGLLFGITYLFQAFNLLMAWDKRPYGWFCLFVAVNALVAGGLDGNAFGTLIWWAWAVLWLTGFIECALDKSLGRFPAWLAVVEGILTAWLPGLLILSGRWQW
ncbi:AmiS/UreI family transporter [Conchiformibius steedae]|uniref:AmiS/UreI family transporter n=1 Tax=Conchiformibius steedae TaxID=153493 RepID=UPI0026EC0FEC|nr:AmiS/UreI family transporter [Conchiformibius steedae]